MFIVLMIYDEKILDYRQRNIMLASIIDFHPINYSDIDEGTYINTGYSRLTIMEPIDEVVKKMVDVYKEGYSIVINEVLAKIKRGDRLKKKPAK